jgi:hypothetical protein
MEVSVKLSPAQAYRVEQQIDGRAIPDRVEFTSQLQDAFGDHTFFVDAQGLHIVDAQGLHIVEPSASDEVGKVVILGKWANDEHTKLRLNEPTLTDTVVELGAPGDGDEE